MATYHIDQINLFIIKNCLADVRKFLIVSNGWVYYVTPFREGGAWAIHKRGEFDQWYGDEADITIDVCNATDVIDRLIQLFGHSITAQRV